MIEKAPSSLLKTAAVGALAGALVFFALDAVKAQSAMTVKDLHSNMRPYVGTTIQITGLVQYSKTEPKWMNGANVPAYKFNLYEQDSKGKKTPYYVYVSLPTTAFQTAPVDGQIMSITGPLKWGYMFGAIDP